MLNVILRLRRDNDYNYKKIKEKYFPLDLRYFLEPKAIETPQAKGVK